MLSIKNIKAGNLNKFLISIVISILVFKIVNIKAESDMSGTKTDIKILDNYKKNLNKIREKIV